MRDGQLSIYGRPCWVSATVPLVSDGLEVGDLWVDLFNSTTKRCTSITPPTFSDIEAGGSGGGAPVDAAYITKTANSTLSNEFALSSLSSGIMVVTTTTGDLISRTVTGSGAISVTNGDGQAGNINITVTSTSDITEGSNLYYTDDRVDARIALSGGGDLSVPQAMAIASLKI